MLKWLWRRYSNWTTKLKKFSIKLGKVMVIIMRIFGNMILNHRLSEVAHCWDLLNCLRALCKLREMTSVKLDKKVYVLSKYILHLEIHWQTDKNIFWSCGAFGSKTDDDMVYDPDSTKIPFYHSLGFIVAQI